MPGYGLDHFPSDIAGDEADNLLASWTCLWHPNLIAAAGAAPEWRPTDSPPADYADSLIVIPKISHAKTPAGFADRVSTKGAVVLPSSSDRAELVAAALAAVEPNPLTLDDPVVKDFFALGFCYLQVELLTRQMRYASYVDDAKFRDAVVAAANAAVANDEQRTKDQLTRSFDLLLEARDHYYPSDAYLINLVLTAPTTLGPALGEELRRPWPTNLLITAQSLEALAERDPAAVELLREQWAADKVSLVGGEYEESELSLASPEQIAARLRKGHDVYARLVGRAPDIFGRRQNGLSPLLPQILTGLGYKAALCVPLDGEPLPVYDQCKTRWEGAGGPAIECLSREVLDAAEPGSFLKFPAAMGYSIDRHHVATTVLAHWPGLASPWYDDFRRTMAYGPILGKFVTLDFYFDHTDTPYGTARYDADQYRSFYWTRAVAAGTPDPLSSQIEAAAAAARQAELSPDDLRRITLGRSGEPSTSDDQARASLARAITAGGQGEGCLVVNPFSFARRVLVETNALAAPPAVDDLVRFADKKGAVVQAVVDVPAAGFAWISSGGSPSAPKKGKAPPPLIEGNVVRNEYFEIAIQPTTGGVQTFRQYTRRGNLLSQQIVFCHEAGPSAPQSRDEADRHSTMACDELTATESTAVVGELAARGRLLDPAGQLLARFTQRVRVQRGSRVAQIAIELDPQTLPGEHPWRSYYACRFAWADMGDDLYRTASLTTQRTDARRITSPFFVDVRGVQRSTTLLTGGLAMHRRIGSRELDTLLIVRGESARSFRLGVGLDLTHPLPHALEFVAGPDKAVPHVPCPLSGPSGWLFHLDAKNVVATSWRPLEEDGQVVGVRAGLLETEGRPTKATLRALRDLHSARQTDLVGKTLVELSPSGDGVKIELGGYEFVEVEVRWDSPRTSATA